MPDQNPKQKIPRKVKYKFEVLNDTYACSSVIIGSCWTDSAMLDTSFKEFCQMLRQAFLYFRHGETLENIIKKYSFVVASQITTPSKVYVTNGYGGRDIVKSESESFNKIRDRTTEFYIRLGMTPTDPSANKKNRTTVVLWTVPTSVFYENLMKGCDADD